MKLLIKNVFLCYAILMITACSGLSVSSFKSKKIVDTSKTQQQMVTIEDSRAIKLQLEKALLAVKNHDFEAAESAFKTMLALGATSPVTLNHYGIYLRSQWRMREAETIYLQALSFSPYDSMTHWNLAVFYDLYKGDYRQAVVHYKAYQKYAERPDKRVEYWITDLTRRVNQES